MSDAYTPLFDPETDTAPVVGPVDLALNLARNTLAALAPTNIHNESAVLQAAVRLEIRLRALVAALDQQAGRDPLEGIDPNLLDWHQGALNGDSVVCAFPQPGRPDYPCIWNRAYHPNHRDVFGNTWPARGGDDR
ncbi:hypothetical protein OG233_14030 [Streptomyces sp. NBC_01218]|uniref:hypothetical protein n=1 Tax=Streptomyces sp. NBC_01218 TaxID=2903780 RepID=UPI002E0DF494|nr:hypothetical protein OG233_14030 [Streptomyces sp. NBC_01218]